MKLGFYISLIIDDEEFYKCVELIKEKKYYDSVEFFYPEEKRVRENHFKRLKYVQENLKHIKEYTMHLPFMETNIASKNIEKLNYSLNIIKEAILFAKENNVNKVTLHLGQKEDINDDCIECLNRNISSVKEILEFSKKNKMIICVENLCGSDFVFRTKNEITNFFSMIKDENLKMTLDIGHYAVMNEDFKELIDEMKNLIFHIHIHDNHKTEDEHLNLGFGSIDLKKIIEDLKYINYQGVLLVETGFKKEDYENNYLFLKSLI